MDELMQRLKQKDMHEHDLINRIKDIESELKAKDLSLSKLLVERDVVYADLRDCEAKFNL
jgi:hypothetical protein